MPAKSCPHNTLRWYGKNGGVYCVRCGGKWPRTVHYVDDDYNRRVSQLVRKGKLLVRI